jgi:hypothetical protein
MLRPEPCTWLQMRSEFWQAGAVQSALAGPEQLQAVDKWLSGGGLLRRVVGSRVLAKVQHAGALKSLAECS